jgi:hypothetical protein
VEDFLLKLPLGTDSDAAIVEQLVSQRLFTAELGRVTAETKLQQW